MPKYYVQLADQEIALNIRDSAEGLVVEQLEDGLTPSAREVDFTPVHYSPATGEGLYSLLLDGLSYQLYLERREHGFRVAIWRHRFDVTVLSEREWRLQKVAPKQAASSGKLVISAPMPGLVKLVPVSEGDDVSSGERLVVLEAMKMENDINAPREGRVALVHVQAGAVVESGRQLVTLE